MHGNVRQFVKRVVRTMPLPEGLVVEVGARYINGSIRYLFPGREYIGVDCATGKGVDVVESGATYQPPTPPAIVITTETLEHAPDAEMICQNALLILRPGGVFIVTTAALERQPHSSRGGKLRRGEFYRGISADMLRVWLTGFERVNIEHNIEAGDLYATAVKPC